MTRHAIVVALLGAMPIAGDTVHAQEESSLEIRRTKTTALCCLLVQATTPLTFDGRALSPVVDVWTLAAAQPAAEPEEKPDESSSDDMPSIRAGAVFGAVAGCWAGIGAATASPDVDISPGGLCVLNGAFFAGVGAGAVALAQWIKRR